MKQHAYTPYAWLRCTCPRQTRLRFRFLDVLDARFGAHRVLGGACLISARLDHTGRVVHLNDAHRLAFGERTGGRSTRVDAVAEVMAGCRFEARASANILRAM